MTVVNVKIWTLYEAFYLQAMLFNCQSSLRPMRRISNAFAKLPPEVTEEDLVELPVHAILKEIQNLVIQGVALLRYFWPIRNPVDILPKLSVVS